MNISTRYLCYGFWGKISVSQKAHSAYQTHWYNVWDEVHPMLMTIRWFLPGLASFGPMVFETKMEIWRVYGRRRTQRDDDISHNLVGRWTNNKLSGGVKQRTFHIHTCRIDWKPPKRYKNHVSDLILIYMYWLSIYAIKSISYRIKHDNKYLLSESRSFYDVIFNNGVIHYWSQPNCDPILYSIFIIKIIIENPLKLMHVMAWSTVFQVINLWKINFLIKNHLISRGLGGRVVKVVDFWPQSWCC